MGDEPPSNAPVSAPSIASLTSTQEDVVSKYKRLLSMARSSLEANQALLTAKDQEIAQLSAILSEERAKKSKSLVTRSQREDESNLFPRRVLCRVDIEGLIWILLEYESAEDEWKFFVDEISLQDFIKRTPGAPLIIPQKRISVDESIKINEDTKKRVDKIAEEFRRYKVRMEISLKEKDAEVRAAQTSHQQMSSPHTNSSIFASPMSRTSSLPSALEKALSLGNMGDSTSASLNETQKLHLLLQEQEQKWRSSYEKLNKELELLKTKGAESVLAAQWRGRYESCVKDKEELQQRLSLYTQVSSEVYDNGKSLEQLYIELQEEYKSLRRRLHEVIHEYMLKDVGHLNNAQIEEFAMAFNDILQFYRIDQRDLEDSRLLNPQRTAHKNSHLIDSSGNSRLSTNTETGGKGMAESKVQYVRQMIFQFLSCRDPEVKTHIESALMAMFRFSDEEKAAIEARQEEDSLDALTSISSFFGSLTSTSLT